MREERGTIAGDFTVTDSVDFLGAVARNLVVAEGGRVYLRGAVYGDVIVGFGGRVHIYGRVAGNLIVRRGGKVIHSGTLGGDAVNEGGRLYIDNTAIITGRIKTKSGETRISRLFSQTPPAKD
jgi:hypothetical protein